MRRIATVLALILAVLSLSACSPDSAQREETEVARRQLGQFLQSQPVPEFNYSQLRQNLIEIETAQANTTATTSFMFLMAGAGATGPLVHSCPSIGFPIPATYQLTAPETKVYEVTVPQMEATGVYTGETTATYVICVGADGTPYAVGHEGFVTAVTGPAHWDNVKGEIALDGPSSAEFSTGE